MGSLKLYDLNISLDSIASKREQAYLALSAEQKFFALLNLNRISIEISGVNPLKKPQGKCIIIKK